MHGENEKLVPYSYACLEPQNKQNLLSNTHKHYTIIFIKVKWAQSPNHHLSFHSLLIIKLLYHLYFFISCFIKYFYVFPTFKFYIYYLLLSYLYYCYLHIRIK